MVLCSFKAILTKQIHSKLFVKYKTSDISRKIIISENMNTIVDGN